MGKSVRVHLAYFSCGSHEPYLELSLRSLIATHTSSVVRVWVCEDPDDPISQSGKVRLGLLGLPLVFKMSGKVTGYGEKTVLSELEMLSGIAKELSAGDWLAKVDSDVLFLNGSVFEMLSGCTGELVGQCERVWDPLCRYVQGGIYFLRAGCTLLRQSSEIERVSKIVSETKARLDAVAESLDKPKMAQCPEDAVVDALVRATGGTVLLKDYYLPLWHLDRLQKTRRGLALRRPSLRDLLHNPRGYAGVVWHDAWLRQGRYSVIHFQNCKERMANVFTIITGAICAP